MRLEEILVVCLPFPLEEQKKGAARLRRRPAPLDWLKPPKERAGGGTENKDEKADKDETEDKDVEVIHPTEDHQSLAFRVGDRELLLLDKKLPNAFAKDRTLLWFPSQGPPPDLLVLTWQSETENEHQFFYRRVLATRGASESDDPGGDAELAHRVGRSAAGEQGPLGRCLYRRAEKAWENARRLDLTVRVAADRAEWEAGGELGYANPVLLRIDPECMRVAAALSGAVSDVRDLRSWERLAGPEGTLRALLGRPESRLALEAVFAPSARLPIARRYLRELAVRWVGGPRTAVERLLVGAASPPSPVPFLVLDALGGSFVLDAPLAPAAGWTWRAPEGLRGNLGWLAERMVEAWGGGMVSEAEAASYSGVPWPAPPAGGWRPGRFFRAAVDEVPELLASGIAALRRAAAEGSALAARLADVLGELPSGEELSGHLRVLAPAGPEGTARLGLDEAGLLAAVARLYLAPRSPVRAPFPRAEELPANAGDALRLRHREAFAGRCLDLLATPRDGAARFLLELDARTREAASDAAALLYARGWWDEWLRALYRRDAASPRHLELPEAGFVLAVSALGREPLGAGTGGEHRPGEVRL